MKAFLSLILLVSLTTACTTFPGADPVGRDAMEPLYSQQKQKPKRKIVLNFRYQWLPDPENFKMAEESTLKFKNQLLDVLNESGSFEVVSNAPDAEIWDVELNYHENGIWPWKVVSAVTVFVIPFWDSKSFMELKFNIKKTNPTGHEIYRGELSDNFVTVNQTLLLFAMPFTYKNAEKIRGTLYRNFLKMYFNKYPNG